jgi:NO-binding membrane sensor protein with MHYT domain
VAQAVDHVHHFEMGGWLLGLAYITSVIGSTIGLACTLQSRYATSPRVRIAWLALAAISIGGVGIWVMHFIAMLGFATPGMPVRYEIMRTVLSALLSVGAVFLGLLVFGVRREFALWRLLAGGLITGLAVNLMHYTGMWAVQIKGEIGYNAVLVLLSIVIAVVAATAAFWFTVVVDSLILRVIAGLIMGVAVTGMHYTGMAAMSVQVTDLTFGKTGATAVSLLVPIGVLVLLVVIGLGFAVMAAPTDEDLAGREYLERLAASRADMGPPIVQPGPHRISTVRRTTPVPTRRDR